MTQGIKAPKGIRPEDETGHSIKQPTGSGTTTRSPPKATTQLNGGNAGLHARKEGLSQATGPINKTGSLVTVMAQRLLIDTSYAKLGPPVSLGRLAWLT
jgi:hypothetical protein